MAHIKDTDTSIWLHNKLGSTNDQWSSGSICSQLNQDILRNIRECFTELIPTVRLKLLLSILHIPRRNAEEWRTELEDILEVASVDSDQWVSMLAEFLKNHPETFLLNFRIEENSTVFTDLLNDLKKSMKKLGEPNILPLEYLYLNKNAFNATAGHMPLPTRHFNLVRKSKSASLRADLLSKASDAASGKRVVLGSAVPIRCRGFNASDNGPLKGIPSQKASLFSAPSSQFRVPNTPISRTALAACRIPTRPSLGGVKRDSSTIKQLDVSELPAMGRDAKRKKKEQEKEEKKENQLKAEKGSSESTNATIPNEPGSESMDTTPAMPDYAAGLISMAVPPSPAASSLQPPTPAAPPNYAPPSTPNAVTAHSESNSEPTAASNKPVNPPAAAAQRNPQEPFSSQYHPSRVPPASVLTINPHAPNAYVPPGYNPMNPGTSAAPQATADQTIPPQPSSSSSVQPTRKLQLSKETMMKAQEIFKKANKVTRPEKALILGFMAGSRDNPCPSLGHLVTIKLSENNGRIQQPSGQIQNAIIEEHFQMNYNSGEWKIIQKIGQILS